MPAVNSGFAWMVAKEGRRQFCWREFPYMASVCVGFALTAIVLAAWLFVFRISVTDIDGGLNQPLTDELCSLPEKEEEVEEEAPPSSPAVFVMNRIGEPDLVLASYQDPALREWVVAFFCELSDSEEIAEAILSNAVTNDIPPALAFALCAEESSFLPRAFNRNGNNTVDRGLFQLNSASFPRLKTEDFYDIETNAWYGLAHLRLCLTSQSNVVAGLAMYNAGYGRVNSGGTPKSTLNYISRILERQRKIEEAFIIEYSSFVKMERAKDPDPVTPPS